MTEQENKKSSQERLVNIGYFGGSHGAFLKFFVDKFSIKTAEIYEYAMHYPNHYKAMNPNLPKFNNIANPFYLWNKSKDKQ